MVDVVKEFRQLQHMDLEGGDTIHLPQGLFGYYADEIEKIYQQLTTAKEAARWLYDHPYLSQNAVEKWPWLADEENGGRDEA